MGNPLSIDLRQRILANWDRRVAVIQIAERYQVARRTVRQFLVLTLQGGEIVVMDYLSSHEQAGFVEVIEQVRPASSTCPRTHAI